MTKCEIILSQRIWIRNTYYEIIHIHTHTHTHTHMDFPCDSACKESTFNVGELGLIPGLGRSPGEGNGYPF